MRPLRPSGFTLVELLVVIAILAILAAVLVPAAGLVRDRARETVERSAARSLLVAWNEYAFDQGGRIMPGYRSGLPAYDAQGNAIAEQTIGVAAARYPWRIAPYLGHAMGELVEPGVGKDLAGLEAASDPDYLYRASLYPRFGLNGTFVGGDEGAGGFNPGFESAFGRFYRTRLSEISRPESLIVCASAAATGSDTVHDGVVEGYFRVKPPFFTSAQWQDGDEASDPALLGHVSPRWGGRAVVGFVSGEVDARPIDGLRDMRLWADQADARDWRLLPQGGG
ncbi:MAG: type II secretion system protein [Phycisphaerales bacterium]|jgi:prepilin-type N-terminal cleavage/methylation domain-containing protein